MKKNRNAERRRRENRGAEGAEHRSAEDRGAVCAENRGAEGAEGGEVWGGGVPLPTGGGGCAPPQNFFWILDHEIAFLAQSGRYILQFSCLLYAQNPAIYIGDRYI